MPTDTLWVRQLHIKEANESNLLRCIRCFVEFNMSSRCLKSLRGRKVLRRALENMMAYEEMSCACRRSSSCRWSQTVNQTIYLLRATPLYGAENIDMVRHAYSLLRSTEALYAAKKSRKKSNDHYSSIIRRNTVLSSITFNFQSYITFHLLPTY